MFDRIRRFAVRAPSAPISDMSLGLGVLVAGVAAVIGILMVAGLRFAMNGAGRRTRGDRAGAATRDSAPRLPQTRPA
jgi:hypothetical protein